MYVYMYESNYFSPPPTQTNALITYTIYVYIIYIHTDISTNIYILALNNSHHPPLFTPPSPFII